MTSLVLALVLVGVSSPPPSDPDRAQYDLARALGERNDDGFADLALEEFARYDRLFPSGRFRDDVHYRMARLERERGREHRAAARLVEVLLVDAGSDREKMAREDLESLLREQRSLRALKPRFDEAISRYRLESAEDAPRRFAFLRALLLIDDRDVADLVVAEGVQFLDLYPDADGADEVAFAVGETERRRGEDRRAISAWQRLSLLRPLSPMVPRAQLAIGDLLEDRLDDHHGALAAYEPIARGRPEVPEAATAWLRMGEIERIRLKRYEIAIRDYDEVLRGYPEHPEAFPAMLAKASAWQDGFHDAERAERVLLDGVERYPEHVRAPEALARAARIRERGLDDLVGAAELNRRLAARYPRFEEAESALFHAAELYEKAGQAREAEIVYREVGERFPDGKLVGKARKRADKLASAAAPR